MISHYNEVFNADNGFDLQEIETFSQSTLRFFIINMKRKDMIAFARLLKNSDKVLMEKIFKSPKLRNKLEIYILMS